jgi:hypothetical protein
MASPARNPSTTGTAISSPKIGSVKRRRRRIRLTRLSGTNRGPNQGAPMAEDLNAYPFPFQGLYAPARHGHHPVFKVGTARRVGAWRVAATGTMGGNHKRNQRQP